MYMKENTTALFTFVPEEPAISIIKSKIEHDIELQERTIMSINHITVLLGFCQKHILHDLGPIL